MLKYLNKKQKSSDMPTTFHHCIVGSSEYSKIKKRNNSKNVGNKELEDFLLL